MHQASSLSDRYEGRIMVKIERIVRAPALAILKAFSI
jgi:hypothetical protein